MRANAFARRIAAFGDYCLFGAGVFLNQLRVMDFLKEGVINFCRVGFEAVRCQLERDFYALAQVLDVFLSRYRITLAHSKVDDELGFGVNAQVSVLIASLAVALVVVLRSEENTS